MKPHALAGRTCRTSRTLQKHGFVPKLGFRPGPAARGNSAAVLLRFGVITSFLHGVGGRLPTGRGRGIDLLGGFELDSNAIEQRLAFMHIPKNGGSVIEDAAEKLGVRWGMNSAALSGKYDMPDGHLCNAYHMPIYVLDKISPEDARVSYADKEVFCVVRDPVKRAVSEYIYLLDMPWGREFDSFQHTGLYKHPECSREGLNGFIQTALNMVLQDEPYIDDCHHLPQSRFIWDPDGMQLCKHIFRMENLAETFNSFMAAFGSNIRLDEGLHHSSNAKCPGLSEADLDNSTLELLNEVYDEDFRLLGYQPPL